MKKIEISNTEYYVIYTFLIVLSLSVGFLIVSNGEKPSSEMQSGVKDMRGGDYIRFVFIGSSNCPYCTNEVHNSVRYIKDELRKFSDQIGYGYLSTGVSVELNSEIGKRYLEKTDTYDELIAGASWYNIGIYQYNWNSHPHPASTPQLLIT